MDGTLGGYIIHWHSAPGTVQNDPGGSLPDGQYEFTIADDQVLGGEGAFDNDGSMPFVSRFHRFFGDHDGDGDVDATDALSFRSVLLGLIPYDSAFDYDGGGVTDALDFLQFRNRYLLGSI